MRSLIRPVSVPIALIATTFLCLAEPARADPAGAQSATELLSATRQARDAREFDRAEQLARQGMARFQDPVWPLTLALILADKGESSEALAVLAAPWPGGLPRIEQLMAEGYASQRGGDPWRAMIAYGEVLLVQPDNAEARDALAAVMASVRAAHGAVAVAGVNPQREADRAAALVRWSNSLPATDLASRFAETDQALALLDSLIATARGAEPVDEAMVRRLRIDRLLALRDRLRMAEVIAEAQSMSASAPLPAYAMEALADALLYERRPAEALAAYEVGDQRRSRQSERPIWPRFRVGRSGTTGRGRGSDRGDRGGAGDLSGLCRRAGDLSEPGKRLCGNARRRGPALGQRY